MKMTLTTIALTFGLALVGCNDDAYEDSLYDEQPDVVLDDGTQYDPAPDYDGAMTDPTEDRYEVAKPPMDEPTGPSAEVTGDTEDLFADPPADSSDPEPGMAIETDAAEPNAAEDSTQAPSTSEEDSIEEDSTENPRVIDEVE
ncbi:hypothetical protein [Neorhodopirellula pilleata]|uniref:Uncharacterized protein n=1 Tax=Neorhodopirellula pilleata TaxID=2714738 RepID=A0A5C6AA81_9BACT|nr:hypothetical protein [Neorhodopirellula pilleata]TWT96218.1 hypothetical protein Pla100_26940 [Neorhodopirellula pilleata]